MTHFLPCLFGVRGARHSMIWPGEAPMDRGELFVVDDHQSATHTHRFRGWDLSLTTIELVDGLAERFSGSSPTNPFDLGGTTLLFTPEDSATGYGVTRSMSSAAMNQQAGMTRLPLDENDSTLVIPVRPVLLYGIEYSEIYITSNGYLTFGQDDFSPENTMSHHLQLPRISGMMGDFFPSEISYGETADRFMVSFILKTATGEVNSFQIDIFFDGRIRISFFEIESTEGFLTGVSRGNGDLASFASQNFAATLNHPLTFLDYELTGFGSAYFLRWTSVPEARYLVRYSSDLINWETYAEISGELDSETTFRFSELPKGIEDGRFFMRVESR